ncbi:methylamine utilization protein [Pseudidiomarina aestuarii]|uniref:Methylamine utilization protein n=1 Tax=Pseudidiomarina aestuarii TaxID=624146 RepID=A0A7Z7ETR3_9GAMM|nr:methylamine utilization protein [Pseudidiomarina aestuarii]RUO41378.1 methylamine utilization protein [Pseudidiomarina aestuarii]
MLKFQIASTLVVGFILAGLSIANAQTLTVTVLDQQGQPLADAVVSIDTGQTQQPLAGGAIMDQVDTLFNPFVLTVPAGTTVRFPNSDNIRHQVYSFSAAKPFELPLYSNREAPTIDFNEAGIVVLGCNIHDHMRAYIYVTPHTESQVTNAAGQAQLTWAAADSATLRVWYPGLSETITEEFQRELTDAATELTVQLPVTIQRQETPELSPLQQRFNRRKGG